MVSTPYKFQFNPNRYNGLSIWYANEQLAPFKSWTSNNQKTFTLRMNFLRPSEFDFYTDDSNSVFNMCTKNV